MLPFLLGVVGLSVDGATVFAARRELQGLADGAAQAAVTRVDTGRYEATGTVALDAPAAARAAARAAGGYLAARRPGVAWAVEPDAQGVVVEVGEVVPLTFLRLVGRQTAYVTARAPAVLRHGIEAAS
jgi:Flp pilus assembly protein TadG